MHGVGKMIHASTGSIYGHVYNSILESLRYNPVSFYGVSKSAAELYLKAMASYNPKFRYTILRYFHVYGPRQEYADNGGVIPIFIRHLHNGTPLTIFGNGSQTRTFTWVKDVVAANFFCANKSKGADGQAFNISSGEQTTLRSMLFILEKTMKKSTKILYEDWRLGDIPYFDVSNKKSRRIGIKYEMPLAFGLKKTIDWYKEYFDGQQENEREGVQEETKETKGSLISA
jgi:UDP-glucose 4-epimerase